MTDDQDRPRPTRAPREKKPFAKGERFGGKSAPAKERAPQRPREAEEASGERIAKRLARAGIASRREAEGLIADGRVRVNGQVLASPALNVEPGDRIELDGKEIPAPERTRLFLFHKPAGVMTTNRDPEGRRTVFDVLPEGLPRLMTVGRLDFSTEGLLLLTNDGGLSRVLELPSTGWLRRYRVRVHGEVDEAKLKELAQGIAVDGVFYGAIEAELERNQGSNAWLSVGLREGKNREVKNVMGALGLEVNRLIRVSYGPFQLGELEEGQVQELKGRMLRDQLGERLIEEAGADFEAEVRKPFTNRPTARGQEPATAAPAREEPGEGGLIRNRKRDRHHAREDALGRLSTKPERGFRKDKPFGSKPRGRDEAPAQPARERSSNVWMAPGARPQGKATPERAAAQPRRQSGGEGLRKKRESPPRQDGEGGYRARPQQREAGGDAPRPFRPRRDDGGAKPFKPRRAEGENQSGAAARPARREGERPVAARGDKPFLRREDGERGGRPFKPRRGEGDRAGSGERPARRFSERPQGEGNRPPSKPRKRVETEGRAEGARPERRASEHPAVPHSGKPFVQRENGERPFKPRREAGGRTDAGERPARRFDERPRREGAERTFKPRRGEGDGPGTGGERPSVKAPARREGPRKDGAPRSFSKGPQRDGGTKPFAGKPRGGGAKPGGGRSTGRGPSKPRGGA